MNMPARTGAGIYWQDLSSKDLLASLSTTLPCSVLQVLGEGAANPGNILRGGLVLIPSDQKLFESVNCVDWLHQTGESLRLQTESSSHTGDSCLMQLVTGADRRQG